MIDYSDDSTSFDFSDKEKLEMLENWFQQRTAMTSRALRLILLPLIAVVVFALASFWFMYVPNVNIIMLSLLGASLIVWVICLFMGGKVLRRVRTGDTIMLRKIRSSSHPDKS